jgi:hypothetical protein
MIAVLLSFSATNSVVFAQYTLSLFDLPITDYTQTVVSLGVATFSIGGQRPTPYFFDVVLPQL